MADIHKPSSAREIGIVLIILGAFFVYFKTTDAMLAWIRGEGEQVITALLIIVMFVYVYIIFFGKPETKAIALAWVLVP